MFEAGGRVPMQADRCLFKIVTNGASAEIEQVIRSGNVGK